MRDYYRTASSARTPQDTARLGAPSTPAQPVIGIHSQIFNSMDRRNQIMIKSLTRLGNRINTFLSSCPYALCTEKMISRQNCEFSLIDRTSTK